MFIDAFPESGNKNLITSLIITSHQLSTESKISMIMPLGSIEDKSLLRRFSFSLSELQSYA